MSEETLHEKQQKSFFRAEVLRGNISDYQEALKTMPTGFGRWPQILENQTKIKNYFKASDEDWENWRWQMKNRITEIAVLKELLTIDESELEEIAKTGSKYRWAISPYYLSLIDPAVKNDPVKLQCFPSINEYLDNDGYEDPMAEEYGRSVSGRTCGHGSGHTRRSAPSGRGSSRRSDRR